MPHSLPEFDEVICLEVLLGPSARIASVCLERSVGTAATTLGAASRRCPQHGLKGANAIRRKCSWVLWSRKAYAGLEVKDYAVPEGFQLLESMVLGCRVEFPFPCIP